MSQEFVAALETYRAASLAIWNDAETWHAEAARQDARPLAWPRPEDTGTHFEKLLALLFNADVDVVLVLLRSRDDPYSPPWPPDVRDPKLQTVLRMVQLGNEAGAAAMAEAFGGERITGRREYQNQTAEALAEFALQAARDLNLSRDEAFDLVGLPRRRGFRAVKRTHRKK